MEGLWIICINFSLVNLKNLRFLPRITKSEDEGEGEGRNLFLLSTAATLQWAILLFFSFPWPLWEKGLFSLFADIRGNASHFRVIAIWRERRVLCKVIMLRCRLRRLWKARELPPNYAPLILRTSCGVLLPIMEIAKTYCNFKYEYFYVWEKRLLYSC